jgi:hypothetical protein
VVSRFDEAGKYLYGFAVMEAEEYRRRARRCLAVARRVSDPQRRAEIVDLASKWMLFAQRVEWQKPRVQQQQQKQPKQKAKE